MRVMFGGDAVILLLFLGNAVVRGAGDPTIAMRLFVIANGLNLVFVPCLVLGLGFSAARGDRRGLGDNAGAWIGAVYTLWHLFRGKAG